MKVGDRVEWISQSSGFKTMKVGTIRVVIPPYGIADRYIPKGYTSWRMDGRSRNHKSYLVEVEGKGHRLYWPLVKYLKKAHDAFPFPFVSTIQFQHKTPTQEIASPESFLLKKIDALETAIGENSRRHGIFMRRIKKMLGYKNWPDIQGDFLDGVATLLEQRLEKNEINFGDKIILFW